MINLPLVGMFYNDMILSIMSTNPINSMINWQGLAAVCKMTSSMLTFSLISTLPHQSPCSDTKKEHDEHDDDDVLHDHEDHYSSLAEPGSEHHVGVQQYQMDWDGIVSDSSYSDDGGSSDQSALTVPWVDEWAPEGPSEVPDIEGALMRRTAMGSYVPNW